MGEGESRGGVKLDEMGGVVSKSRREEGEEAGGMIEFVGGVFLSGGLTGFWGGMV